MSSFRADPIVTQTIDAVSGSTSNITVNAEGIVLTSAGSVIALKKDASANITGSDPSYGFFWVSESSPTSPIFRDSTGTDTVLNDPGITDHALLTNLSWSLGGHVGPPNEIARFGASSASTGSSDLAFSDATGDLFVKKSVTFTGAASQPTTVTGNGTYWITNSLPTQPVYTDDGNITLFVARTQVTASSPENSHNSSGGYGVGTQWIDEVRTSSYVQARSGNGTPFWGLTFAQSWQRKNTIDRVFAAGTPINLETEDLTPSGYVWDSSAYIVTASDAGRYNLHFHATVKQVSGSGINTGAMTIDRDGGGGFIAIVGTNSYCTTRGLDERSQISIDYEIDLPAGSGLRLLGLHASGSDTLAVEANTAAFIIKKLNS